MTQRTRVNWRKAEIVVICALGLCCASARAAWSNVPLAICSAPGDQSTSWAVSDGSGGAIVVWVDHRSGQVPGFFAQRLTADGTALWSANGVPIPGTVDGMIEHFTTSVASDGRGGALIASVCQSGSGIRAQRVGPDGQSLWPAGGVAVSAIVQQIRIRPVVVPDGSGGGIIAWPVRGSCDIRANRVASDGTLSWGEDGVLVRHGACDSSFSFTFDRVRIAATSDGSGGAILAWTDGSNWPQEIRAQRLNGSGSALWPANGVELSVPSGNWGITPVAVSDGAGGAVIAWQDWRIFQFHVFAQRLDASGQPLWAADGEVLDASGGPQYDARVVPDGLGGAFVSWTGFPAGQGRRFLQRILPGGGIAWGNGSTLLSTAVAEVGGGEMVSDGAGGVICTWLMSSAGPLVAQRVGEDGTVLWSSGGRLIASSLQLSDIRNPVVEDGSGGLTAFWGQNGANGVDLFAGHVDANSVTLSAPPRPTAKALDVRLAPNPARGGTVVFVVAAEATAAKVSILDVRGRVVRELGTAPAGSESTSIRWDGLDVRGRAVSAGIYFARVTTRHGERVVRFAVVR